LWPVLAALCSTLAAPFITLAATSAPPPSLPIALEEDAWRPLLDCADSTLQRRLNDELSRRPEWLALVRVGELAVGLVDLTEIEAPRFAQVNGDTMMSAASLGKIAILLAAHQSLAEGKLQPSSVLQRDLHGMIRASSNEPATRVIDRLGAGKVGLQRIASVLVQPRYRLFDPERGGGLWVGSRYPPQGDSLPDPLHGLLHAANATQTCRFYYLLATGRLVDFEHSKSMLEALVQPGLNTKFVRALTPSTNPRNIYRKSGTWGRYHADSVLVWDATRRYIAVAIAEDQDGEALLTELLPALERALGIH